MKLRRTTKTTTRVSLGIATVLLAMLDWMAGATIAEPDGPQGTPPPDEMVPAGASLENGTSSTLRLGHVAIRILPLGARYVLEASNRGDTAEEVEVDVKVLEASISPMARMAPMPQEVSSAKVALLCPPHQSVRRTLELPGLAATRPAAVPANDANAGTRLAGFAPFLTRTFVVADGSPAAVARRAAAAPQAPSPWAMPAGQEVLRVSLGPVAPLATPTATP